MPRRAQHRWAVRVVDTSGSVLKEVSLSVAIYSKAMEDNRYGFATIQAAHARGRQLFADSEASKSWADKSQRAEQGQDSDWHTVPLDPP